MKLTDNLRQFSIVAKANEAEVFLYDQIGTSFWGDGISAKQFADQFKAISKVSRIVLHINSPGGDVFDGAAIYDLVRQSEIPVDVMVDGLAASAAFTVAMAGRKISIGEAGMMMMHNAKAFVGGSAADMRQTADVVEKISNQMADIYARRCNKPLADVKALMDAETWMTAQEAADMGFANEVIKCDPEEPDMAAEVGAAFDLSKFQHVPEQLKMRIAALAGRQILQEKLTATAAKEKVMAEEVKATATAVEVKEDAGKAERDRCSAINALGRQYKLDVQGFIDAGTKLEDVKMAVADLAIARAQEQAKDGGLAHPTVGSLTEGERKDYSVARAILAQAEYCGKGLEHEISAAIAKDLGMEPRGLFVPTRLRPQATGLDTKTNAAGKYTVMTEVRDLIELLRNRAKVIQMGATVLSGLTSTIQFPRQLTGSSGAWVAENPGSDASESDATFGAVTMSPKTYAATTAFSRQLLAQSTVDIENLVRNDLAIAHALAVDAAAINGSGTANQPTGLLKTTGIGDVAIGAAGGAPTYAFIVDLETKIASSNADEAGMAFLTTPVMRGKLKKVGYLDSTYASIPLWNQVANSPGVGELIGYPAYVSNQVPSTLVKTSSSDCHAIILGYWPTLMIGEWGVLDLVVDPYALKKQGMIEITSFQLVDIAVRQPACMAAIQDARNV